VVGVTFSDSDSAPVTKFLNPDPHPVRLFFKFENPTPVQTPATIIDPTVICPCFYLRNDRTHSCYCRNGKVIPNPSPVFPKYMTPGPGPKENAESCRSRLRRSGSGPTSAADVIMDRIRIWYPPDNCDFLDQNWIWIFIFEIGSGQDQDIRLISETKFPWEWFKTSKIIVVVFSLLQ